jgi:3-oxoacyl-[acyl-carrier protein] reductase
MMARRFGRIVNISSIWSIVSKKRRLTYSASKAGLNGMTRALAVELAPYNILINAVAPGYVNTELTRQNNSEQDIHAIKETIPLRRLAEPSEIAETVFFLCSERNTYITGQVITVDGGFTCQ